MARRGTVTGTAIRRFSTECGTEQAPGMPTNAPTWTTERVELLKSYFEAGLSCREIAASIGVSRNAVIGKLSRLNLTRGPAHAIPGAEPRPAQHRSPKAMPGACSTRCCRPSTMNRSRCAGRVEPIDSDIPLLAVRIEPGTLPLADQHAGRGRLLLLRQHADRGPALLRGPQPARLPARLAPARREGIESRFA